MAAENSEAEFKAYAGAKHMADGAGLWMPITGSPDFVLCHQESGGIS